MTERADNRKKTTACEIWRNNHGVIPEDIQAVELLFGDPHDAAMARRTVNKARGDRHIKEKRKKRRNWFQG